MKLTTLSKSKSKGSGLNKVATFKKIFQCAAHETNKEDSILHKENISTNNITNAVDTSKPYSAHPKSNQSFKQSFPEINTEIRSVEDLMNKKFAKENSLQIGKKRIEVITQKHDSPNSSALHSHHSHSQPKDMLIRSLNLSKTQLISNGLLKTERQINQPNILKENKNFQNHKSTTNLHQPTELSAQPTKLEKCKSKSFKSLIKTPPPLAEWNLDRLKFGRKIGKGRFGNVYRAQDKLTNFVVAVKVMSINQIKAEKMESQIVEEIKLQSFLNHPNILKLYGYFKAEMNLYLIVELADNCLFRKLRKKTKFPQEQAAVYSKQVLQSFKYLHSESIIHRDLKPQNIMLCFDVIKLGDFGWSVYSPEHKRQTFCGTLDYVPPEIVNGNYYDQKVDIWSLGVLIYEMTVGVAPFDCNEAEEQTFHKINNSQLDLPMEMSFNLKRLILRILVVNPDIRLTLEEIDASNWMQRYKKSGNKIAPEIYQYWAQL